jgi:copper(I)-binding protein
MRRVAPKARLCVAPALLLVLLLLAGCVYYPTIEDTGGVRIRPQNGRAVRQGAGLAVYVDLASTGKYGDALVGVTAPAGKGEIVDAAGAPIARLEVPGATTVALSAQGAHVRLSELKQAVVPGDVIVVTLVFERSGQIGVVTRVE